jgi:hypothetical protein
MFLKTSPGLVSPALKTITIHCHNEHSSNDLIFIQMQNKKIFSRVNLHLNFYYGNAIHHTSSKHHLNNNIYLNLQQIGLFIQ